MSPFFRSSLIGASVQPARAASCLAARGFGLAASNFKRFGLLRRQLELRDPRGHLRRHRKQRHIARARLLAHARRHDRLQHLPPRAQVVVGHPARQPQHRRRQQRLAIEHRADRLELPPASRLVGQRQRNIRPRCDCRAPTARAPAGPVRFAAPADRRQPARPAPDNRTRPPARPAARPSPPAARPHRPVPTAPARYRKVIAAEA